MKGFETFSWCLAELLQRLQLPDYVNESLSNLMLMKFRGLQSIIEIMADLVNELLQTTNKC